MNQAKKRIVIAITLAEPGGAQRFVLGFSQWLQAAGHEVIIAAGDGEWLQKQCEERGVPFHRLKHIGRSIHPVRDIGAIIELKRFLTDIRPDALHLNSTKMGIVGSIAGHLAHIPRVVYRIGGWVFLEPLPKHIAWLYREAERFTARWKDRIICVHPGDAEVATSIGIRPKIEIVSVPNGIDLPSFDKALLPRNEARIRLGVQPDEFAFGTVAHFYPAKDLPRYIEACAIVHKNHPQTRFLLIGDGMEKPAIMERIHALGLESAVLFPGTFNNNASPLLKGLDAFVLPSAKEGMSWALLEAMAAGLPCVATDVGANKWMLGPDGGWTAPSRSPKDLAERMLEALDPSEGSARGKRAREAVLSRFPLEKTYEGNVNALD